MNSHDLIAKMNAGKPPCLASLGGEVSAYASDTGAVSLRFDIKPDFCHSGNIVQGGFVTAMLDAAMAHAAIAHVGRLFSVPTLDIHVSFLKPALAGRFKGVGRVVRIGKSIGFLEAMLYSDTDVLTATASSTVLIPSFAEEDP